MVKRTLKIGLALGGGGARGLVHIGILKVLEKHGIKPHYIAGTSIGSVVAAAYATGRSAASIEEEFRKTDWGKIVDFTVPKYGLLQGKVVEEKIRGLVRNKSFRDLEIPLRIVAYDLTARERVVFAQGDVARAVRASISIPGVFTPYKIGKHFYIDGGVSDPTPFDIVRAMGADIVVAVDLYAPERTIQGPSLKSETLYEEWKERFITEELRHAKVMLFPERWPKVFRKLSHWVFDKIFYPARVLRMISGRELLPIAKVLRDSVDVMTNNFARERLEHAKVDIKVVPSFSNLAWTDFDKVEQFIALGEKAMQKKIHLLKKKMRKRC